jgi:beta-galactosidase
MQESLIDQFTQVISEEFPGENVYSAGWQEYGYDIYLQARQHRLEHYQKPQKPYVVSEYGDWEYYAMNAGLQQDAWQDLLQSERSSRQLLSDGETRLQQQARNIIEAHNDNYSTPAFADGYWVMFDYNRGYADDLEASGIMSIDRLPKFSYYFYQSQRDADDFAGPLAGGYMVHLATYWQQGSALTVPIYTNAERVDLYLNGKRLGESVIESGLTNLPHPPHTFTVPAFVAGELKAVAFAQGKEVAEHRVITPGEVSQLELALDKSAVAPLAGYNDVVFVRAILLDAAGNNARVNGEPIQFSVMGDARLVSPAWVVTENGTASALLQLGADLSLIKVDAQYKNIHAEMRSLIE